MRVVAQRAIDASVTVSGHVVGEFHGPGIVALVGVTHSDTPAIAHTLANKLYDLRMFDHEHFDREKICIPPGAPRELSASDGGLPVLVISQFTLYANTKKGRRPTWDAAAPRPEAAPLVDAFAQALRERGAPVSTGEFGADMQVHLTNDGPFTIILDSDQW